MKNSWIVFIFQILVLIICGIVVQSRSAAHIESYLNKKSKCDNYVIIDTDAGVDDALGLMLAFDYHNRGLIEILAITCTYGNAYVDQVVKNVLLTRRVSGAEDIKVYRGVENPLLERRGYEDGYFGADGFGNATYCMPEIEIKIEKEHATIAMIRLAKQYPKKITLITLGPMTNLATAIELDPQLTTNLAQVISMGGLIDMLGNAGPTTEFNFLGDPESVHMVLKKSNCPLTIVTWDVAMQHMLPLTKYYEITDSGTEKAQFIRKINELNINRDKDKDSLVLCDILAVIVGVVPELVIQSEEFPVAMELSGKLTRGQLLVDRTKAEERGLFNSSRNCSFIERLDLEKSIQLISQMV